MRQTPLKVVCSDNCGRLRSIAIVPRAPLEEADSP